MVRVMVRVKVKVRVMVMVMVRVRVRVKVISLKVIRLSQGLIYKLKSNGCCMTTYLIILSNFKRYFGIIKLYRELYRCIKGHLSV